MPSAVIFDMDGVLVDSGAAHHESWQRVTRERGMQVSRERFNETFGRPSPDIIRIIWGDHVSPEEVERISDDKERIYRKIVTGNLPLMPGCAALLGRLHAAGLTLAVATSGPKENLDLVLREGEIEAYFAATVTGFEIAHGKPAPDCFQLAAQRIGRSPDECVVVEDAPVGVRAGVAAGMKVIGLAGTHAPEPLWEAGAARVVTTLTDITPEMIESLLAGTS